MAHCRQGKKLLDEEMRILYVALTRAEHRLLLLAAPSKSGIKEWQDGGKRLEAAGSMLDWIGPWLTKDSPAWLETDRGPANDWTWQWHQSLATNDVQPAKQIEEAFYVIIVKYSMPSARIRL